MLVRTPELGEHRREILRFGNDVRRPHELLDDDVVDAVVVERREEIAHVQQAEHVVERAPVDGVARVRRDQHGLQRLVRRQVDRDRHDLGPRDHDVRDLLVGEVEDLVEHLLLALLDLAALGRLADEHLQLGLRVHRP